MKKRWMFLIAELIAMVVIQIMNKLQYRDRRSNTLPRGSKVRRIGGLPVINFGWLKRKDDKETEELTSDPEAFHETYRFVPKEPE